MRRAAATLLLAFAGFPPAFGQGTSPRPQPPTTAAPKPNDALLNALRVAPTEAEAEVIEGKLRSAWADAASPAIKLLLGRGRRELSEGAAADSFDSYAAALDLDPELLEAWRGRAAARVRLGDTPGAVRDLQEVIKREPRNFAAWQDLSRIAEVRGDYKAALAAWQRLLDVDPRSPGAQDRLKELRRKVYGEDA